MKDQVQPWWRMEEVELEHEWEHVGFVKLAGVTRGSSSFGNWNWELELSRKSSSCKPSLRLGIVVPLGSQFPIPCWLSTRRSEYLAVFGNSRHHLLVPLRWKEYCLLFALILSLKFIIPVLI